MALDKIRNKIDGLTNIPAGEQWIGHLQVALQDILGDLLDEIEEIKPQLR